MGKPRMTVVWFKPAMAEVRVNFGMTKFFRQNVAEHGSLKLQDWRYINSEETSDESTRCFNKLAWFIVHRYRTHENRQPPIITDSNVYLEVIYAEHKTLQQVSEIFRAMLDKQSNILVTRVHGEMVSSIREMCPKIQFNQRARTLLYEYEALRKQSPPSSLLQPALLICPSRKRPKLPQKLSAYRQWFRGGFCREPDQSPQAVPLILMVMRKFLMLHQRAALRSRNYRQYQRVYRDI